KMIEHFKELSIFEILRDFRGILSARSILLRPTDQSASNKTFVELAEQAVQTAGKLDAAVGRERLVDYISSLLEDGLLTPASPVIRGAILTSLNEGGPKIFESPQYPHYSAVIWEKLAAAWSTVNGQVGAFYKKTCLEVEKALAELRAAKSKIDQEQFESDTQTARHKEWEAVSGRLGVLKKEKEALGSQRWGIARAVFETERATVSKQKELMTLQSALRGLPDVQRRLEAQIAVLGAQSPPDGNLLIQTTQRLQTLRSGLLDQQQQYDQQLSEDAEKKAQELKITELKEQGRAADEAGKPTLDELFEVNEKLRRVSEQKTRKEWILNPSGFPTLKKSNPGLEREIEADNKTIEELKKQETEVCERRRPFVEKSSEATRAVEQAVQDLEKYVKGLKITQELESAKERLAKKEKEHRLLREQFEVFAHREEILKKLRANLAEFQAELEKCRADIPIAEEALGKAKEEHSRAKAQENLLNQQEQAKALEIQRLEKEKTRLEKELQSNDEKTAFEAGKQARKDKLDADYQTFVKKRLTTFEKMLFSN
ncbi:MAG TPA: hypothetical protein VFU89_04655, partial [Rhabdochlamydiaceae bacterium]|nr:hypothetical protein [Rhabdochlamydiaceae bacterium]